MFTGHGKEQRDGRRHGGDDQNSRHSNGSSGSGSNGHDDPGTSRRLREQMGQPSRPPGGHQQDRPNHEDDDGVSDRSWGSEASAGSYRALDENQHHYAAHNNSSVNPSSANGARSDMYPADWSGDNADRGGSGNRARDYLGVGWQYANHLDDASSTYA